MYPYTGKRHADNLTDRRTDGHIILTLRGFNPISCGCMHFAQLWATQMITKKQCGRPYRDTEICKYKLHCTQPESFGPHCGGKVLL